MKKNTLIFMLAFLGLSYNLNAQTDAALNEDSIKEAKLLALPEVKDFARRVGDTLILKLDNGLSEKYLNYYVPLFYKDENRKPVVETEEDFVTGKIDTISYGKEYRLIDILGAGAFYLINPTIISSKQSMWGNSIESILISKKNGDSCIVGEPNFSIDNLRFINLRFSGPGQQMTDDIEVINSSYSPFKIEFFKQITPSKSQITGVEWISTNEFKINRINESEKPIAPLIYKFNGTKWVLATAQPVKKPATAVKKPIKK
jgi:hypothetical protein